MQVGEELELENFSQNGIVSALVNATETPFPKHFQSNGFYRNRF
jgi:hypothetical protein